MTKDGFPAQVHVPVGAEKTRVYHSSRGSPSARGEQPETWADAEVEIVCERDKSQATTDATDRKAVNATGSSKRDAASEKLASEAAIG